MKKTVVSFSGGRSSALMLHILIENYGKENLIVTFANTGKEKPETLDFVKKCAEYFEIDIVWIEAIFNTSEEDMTQRERISFKVVDYKTASRNGEPFEQMISLFGLPNRRLSICTEYLKIVPMKKYLSSIELTDIDYKTAMGIRIDEQHRAHKFSKQDYIFPLIDFNVTWRDVRKFWDNMPFDLELKDYQGNCDLCMKKSVNKRKTILRENPEIAYWWANMEALNDRGTFDPNFTVEQILGMSKGTFKITVDKWDQEKQSNTLFEDKDFGDISCFCGD